MKLVTEGKTTRNRLGAATSSLRRWKKVVGKSCWFKNTRKRDEEGEVQPPKNFYNEKKSKPSSPGEDNRIPHGVMFIPTTPGGVLKAKLQAMDREVGMRSKCKYVETVGQTILSQLFSKNPWKTHCGREDCLMCDTSPGKCTEKSVVYRIDCTICKDEDKETVYFGETARTGFERMREHQALMKNQNLESPVVEHFQEDHPEVQTSVEMKIVVIKMFAL